MTNNGDSLSPISKQELWLWQQELENLNDDFAKHKLPILLLASSDGEEINDHSLLHFTYKDGTAVDEETQEATFMTLALAVELARRSSSN